MESIRGDPEERGGSTACIAEVMPNTLYVVNPSTGRFVFINPEVQTQLGHAPEEVLSMGDKNKKRIVLSTNIAESALTIPDVMAVIDSGLAR